MIGQEQWELRGANDARIRALESQAVPRMFGAGAALDGTPPTLAPGALPFKVQAGTVVASTSLGGDFTLTFPVPFPNGLLSVVVGHGDITAADMVLATHGPSDKTGATVRLTQTDGSGAAASYGPIRVNWIAVGW